jgi:uncharacterized protein (UPF0335 family)
MIAFEEDAQELYNEIEYQGLDVEVIREFLVMFAERIQNDARREIDIQNMRRKQDDTGSTI